jgi:hypothetical protein
MVMLMVMRRLRVIVVQPTSQVMVMGDGDDERWR